MTGQSTKTGIKRNAKRNMDCLHHLQVYHGRQINLLRKKYNMTAALNVIFDASEIMMNQKPAALAFYIPRILLNQSIDRSYLMRIMDDGMCH